MSEISSVIHKTKERKRFSRKWKISRNYKDETIKNMLLELIPKDSPEHRECFRKMMQGRTMKATSPLNVEEMKFMIQTITMEAISIALKSKFMFQVTFSMIFFLNSLYYSMFTAICIHCSCEFYLQILRENQLEYVTTPYLGNRAIPVHYPLLLKLLLGASNFCFSG